MDRQNAQHEKVFQVAKRRRLKELDVSTPSWNNNIWRSGRNHFDQYDTQLNVRLVIFNLSGSGIAMERKLILL